MDSLPSSDNNNSDYSPPVQVVRGAPSSSSSKSSGDDPLFEAKINNPFSKFFSLIKTFLKNQQNVKISIPSLTFIGLAIALTGGGGIIGGIIVYFFPHNSPILHREVMYQGDLHRTAKGIFLTLPNSDLYTLKPKINTSINFQGLQNGQAFIKGNLTTENFVIEVSEIIPLDSSSPVTPASLTSQFPLTSPNPPNASSSPSLADFPKLYPNLRWETTQKRILIFTSGKRKIEQEGIYLEASQVATFPQDFINYYIEGLKLQDFKETLNAINPEGITITYAKNDLFLTFGIKNIYKGSGEKKQITGYTAYLEHN